MNIVITNTLESENFIKCTSLESAITYVNENHQNAAKWIIGGATLYNRGLKENLIEEVYLTRVQGDYSKFFSMANFINLHLLTRLRHICEGPLQNTRN